MKKLGLIAGIILVVAMATGCTNISKDATDNTFIINKNGSITDISVEDYTDVSFSIDDLERFVTDAVSDYNQKKGEDSISLESYTEENKIVKLIMNYNNIEDYNAFNGTNFTIEKVSDSKLSGDFVDLKGTETTVGNIDGTYNVLTIDVDTEVYIKNMKYYNNVLTLNENNTVSITDSNVGYIIYK